jgi:hypothetical protein
MTKNTLKIKTPTKINRKVIINRTKINKLVIPKTNKLKNIIRDNELISGSKKYIKLYI